MLVLEKMIIVAIRSLFLISCSAFHSVWILLALNYFLEMDVKTFRVVGSVCFFIVLFCCFKLAYKELEKLEAK